MNDLIIRQAEERDIKDIAWIEQRCFSVPWSSRAIQQEVTSNDMAIYTVAEVDGKTVAYMGIWLIVDEGHITNVAVLPEYRKRNIATALISATIDFTSQKGIRKYTLEVRSTNHVARNLYQKFGFKEAGLRKGYYKDNKEDAIIMWRNPGEPARN